MDQIRPFGEHVEGLSDCADKTYAVQAKVQTGDFEQSAFGAVIGRKPLVAQRLRKFKRFERDLAIFRAAAVIHAHRQLQILDPVAQLRVLRGEGVLVDLVEQAQVQQSISLVAQECELALQFGDVLRALLLSFARSGLEDAEKSMLTC